MYKSLSSCPSGVKGETEPAASRHLQWHGGLRPIHLQTRVSVLVLQRIQAQYPLHDPLCRHGVCGSPGETEQKLKGLKTQLDLTDTGLYYIFFLSQSIMNWAKSDPAYNSDSKLFFFSFVAFASGQMTSYPLAVIRTQQQAQGNILYFITIFGRVVLIIVLYVLQLSAQNHVRLQVFLKDLLGYMKDVDLGDIITAWEPALSGLFHVP